MDKKIVIVKKSKEETIKAYITKETMKEIYTNLYYCDTLKALERINKAVDPNFINIELEFADADDIYLESFNLKLKNREKIKSYTNLGKYIIEYAENLSYKVKDSNIRTLLTSISTADNLEEKKVIIKKLDDLSFNFAMEQAHNRTEKRK